MRHGSSSLTRLRGSAKHSVRELPVNWWVQPSVIRTFSSRGDMSMGSGGYVYLAVYPTPETKK
ncbi:TPA: hypothetical protein ND687_004346 [Escherichia coli]|nr:hypothetical protein [Escherichia coli]EEZ0293883.1 hypothetical protein [Escherichia coli]EHZ4936269.1 hypothetical protein [Escherichia coli]MDS1541602.1 hypothetical protein [Escherichia coli]MEB7173674.1 autotransporter adhesin family protein [Escherichia coli]HAX7074677.1 hypothetical protein [Escherichia coli]